MRYSKPGAQDEGGFSLIELLVVMVILGILAGIGMPIYLRQRERAYDAAIASDLRAAALVMESYFAGAERYPTSEMLDLADLGLPQTPEVVLEVVTPAAGDDGLAFCLTGGHRNLDEGVARMTFSSADGAVREQTACP